MTTQIEIYAAIDSNGDYAIGVNSEQALERYAEDVGDPSATEGFRMVKLLVTIPLPEMVTLTGVVAADSGSSLLVGETK